MEDEDYRDTPKMNKGEDDKKKRRIVEEGETP